MSIVVRIKHRHSPPHAPQFYVELEGPGGTMSVGDARDGVTVWAFAERLTKTLEAKVAMSAETHALLCKSMAFPKLLKRYNLADLVAGMNEETRHGEFPFGAPVGREFGAK